MRLTNVAGNRRELLLLITIFSGGRFSYKCLVTRKIVDGKAMVLLANDLRGENRE
jgi:hypothetical protein